MATLESHRFFEYEPSSMIFCGGCARKMVELSLRGVYSGDEVMAEGNFRLLTDDDTEPYMCDHCGGMNYAYEELGDD